MAISCFSTVGRRQRLCTVPSSLHWLIKATNFMTDAGHGDQEDTKDPDEEDGKNEREDISLLRQMER